MADILFFQGDKDAVLDAGDGYPAITFTRRILWVPGDNVELAARATAAGYEEIDSADPRYQLAIQKDGFLRCTLTTGS